MPTPTPFDRLLIANRGEIVTRVARTARRMGLTTITVASDADRLAPHAHACDHVMPLAGDRPADTYLRIDALLAAAHQSGAQAVHPGYGFLSENADFAAAVQAAGLVWVGPSPEAMRAMGDKASARQRMAAAGVPVLPGYDGADQQPSTLQGQAERIGVPLMIKACAGGGGRGMRLVTSAAQLAGALQAAKAEALGAFGDERVLLERALLAPRHVEIQVFADAQGQVLHLGERDCSVQRRHQKLIEEAPSPAVSPALRRRMGQAAVTVAREVGYLGAGTVEFLLDDAGEFWFMEMNTRLQVEHPVTEMLLGVDLVEWQLRVAAGEALPMGQDEVLSRFEHSGHAIEVRLCAEDPALDHLPQAGTVALWQAPPGVRCDHALATGCEVSSHYDSMLGKVIAQGPTRASAIQRLALALDQTVCLGLPTNRQFLARVLRHEAFSTAAVTTAFLSQHFANAAVRRSSAPSWLGALAAVASVALPPPGLPAAWAHWRSSRRLDAMACGIQDGIAMRWQVSGSDGSYEARSDGAAHQVCELQTPCEHQVRACIDGRPVNASWVRLGPQVWWCSEGHELCMTDTRLQAASSQAEASADAVFAPMHGRITQVVARPGAAVAAGALLLVMEAMKMEHRIHAPRAGTLQAVWVAEGEQVGARQLLAEMAP